jgi:hypothetical protein
VKFLWNFDKHGIFILGFELRLVGRKCFWELDWKGKGRFLSDKFSSEQKLESGKKNYLKKFNKNFMTQKSRIFNLQN